MRRLAVMAMVMAAALLAAPAAGPAHAATAATATTAAHAATGGAAAPGAHAASAGAATAGAHAAATAAASGPRYDVPSGFTRCPRARAWHGFFKWASVQHTTCRRAATFMREYAEHADGPSMPRRVGEYTCRIRYWRNDEGDIYASRHVCTRRGATIRFYGMV